MRGIIRGKGNQLTYFIDGRKVSKLVFTRAFPAKPIIGNAMCLSYIKPKPSDGLAVHPDQVNEARDDAIKKGVPTEFLRDGRPVMRSRQHQKEYLKAYGFHNRDGGYGD